MHSQFSILGLTRHQPTSQQCKAISSYKYRLATSPRPHIPIIEKTATLLTKILINICIW
jgi:hypothetical protein